MYEKCNATKWHERWKTLMKILWLLIITKTKVHSYHDIGLTWAKEKLFDSYVDKRLG